MSLAMGDLSRDHGLLLQQLQQTMEVVTAQRSRIAALETEHTTALAERDAVCAERDAAQAEIEKLRLLIRRLQRGRFGRRSERLEQTVAAAEAAQEAAARSSGASRPARPRRRNLGALPTHLPVAARNRRRPCSQSRAFPAHIRRDRSCARARVK